MQINKMHSYTTMENLIYNKSSKMLNLFIQFKKPSIQCCWVGWEAFHLDKVNGIVHHLHTPYIHVIAVRIQIQYMFLVFIFT